jgi:Polyphosphate kinase 2 (PPK2)
LGTGHFDHPAHGRRLAVPGAILLPRNVLEWLRDPASRWRHPAITWRDQHLIRICPIDIESLDKWDAYTEAKEAMFHYTDSEHAPWTVVKSNDKKRARLEAIKHVLRQFGYDGKDEQAIGEPDKALIGPPSMLSEHNPDAPFPDL